MRKQDRIPANAAVIATLREGKRRTAARLGESLVVANAAVANAVPVQQPPATQNQNAPVSIDRFTSDQIERFEPGTELKFTMTGTPHTCALFTIENVVTNRAMMKCALVFTKVTIQSAARIISHPRCALPVRSRQTGRLHVPNWISVW